MYTELAQAQNNIKTGSTEGQAERELDESRGRAESWIERLA